MRGQVQDTWVIDKSACVYLHLFERLQMRGGWLFHRACEKLDLAELCQPRGSEYVIFVGLFSNQALCREIKKKWFTRRGKKGRSKKREKDFKVHPEFECMWVEGELKSASSVVTQICYRGSKECKCDASWGQIESISQ